MLCAGCDKNYQPEDCAPYQKNPDGTFTQACRYCITSWIKLHILWLEFPFWARKEGLDQ